LATQFGMSKYAGGWQTSNLLKEMSLTILEWVPSEDARAPRSPRPARVSAIDLKLICSLWEPRQNPAGEASWPAQ
jgi:hypothetical protein